MERRKGFLGKRSFITGCMTIVIALFITCTMMAQGAAEVWAAPAVEAGTTKVSTKTTTKSTKKNVTMKKAADKTYTKRLPATKKKSTKTTKANSTVVKTETSVLTQVTEKYTKKSKVKVVNTNVVTTVVTTTTTEALTDNMQSGNNSSNINVGNNNSNIGNNSNNNNSNNNNINSSSGIVVKPSDVQQSVVNKPSKYVVSVAAAAPKMDSRVISAYNRLGFTVQIDSTVAYAGHYDTKARVITLRKEDDSIYHELGHFLAFAAGNADKTAGFNSIYAQEKNKYTGSNKGYATQSSSEYFAESLKDYTLNPTALRSSRPMTYSAIEEAINKLTDTYINKMLQIYGPIWK